MGVQLSDQEKSKREVSKVQVRLTRIMEFMQKRHFTAAKPHCIAGVKDYPLMAQFWLLLAECLDQMGQRKDAWWAFERAWILDPEATWTAGFEEKYRDFKPGSPSAWLATMLQTPTVTVAAAMIVKNEERTLGLALERLRDAVDEIIVVDTGSTDRSLEIARQCGASIYHFEWTGSFADARNYALSQVTSDWVLWVDADEILYEQDVAVIHTAAGLFDTLDPPALLRVVQVNHMNGLTAANTSMVRLFPTRFGLRWRGRIHEQVGPAEGMKDVAAMHRVPVRIRFDHDGYDSQVLKDKKKLERNIDLLRKAIADCDTDVDAWTFLGRELASLQSFEEAYSVLQHAVELCLANPMAGRLRESREHLVQVLLQLHRYPEAIEVAQAIVEMDHEIPNGHYTLGVSKYYYAMELLQEAGKDLVTAVKSAQSYRGFIRVNTDILSWKGAEMLAHVAKHQGNLREAKRLLHSALQVQPHAASLLQEKALLEQQIADAVAFDHQGGE